MTPDTQRLGRALAEFYRDVSPRLYRDLEQASVLPPDPTGELRRRAREEWEAFALYACIRGLVAAGGFGSETAVTLDAFHDLAVSADSSPERRALVSRRYAEYGEIGKAGGKAGASTVNRRLGEAAARHMLASGTAPEALVELVSSLHEALAEGAAEAVRAARESTG